ncbi:hypothetical protein HKX48_009264 [Thoreauomyces humboldtii]|nr:hypothetical protein HKX48_009264 [Thoreauomyces humboldtii]
MSAELTIFLVASIASWVLKVRDEESSVAEEESTPIEIVEAASEAAAPFDLHRPRRASSFPASYHSATLSIRRLSNEWIAQEGPVLSC